MCVCILYAHSGNAVTKGAQAPHSQRCCRGASQWHKGLSFMGGVHSGVFSLHSFLFEGAAAQVEEVERGC